MKITDLVQFNFYKRGRWEYLTLDASPGSRHQWSSCRSQWSCPCNGACILHCIVYIIQLPCRSAGSKKTFPRHRPQPQPPSNCNSYISSFIKEKSTFITLSKSSSMEAENSSMKTISADTHSLCKRLFPSCKCFLAKGRLKWTPLLLVRTWWRALISWLRISYFSLCDDDRLNGMGDGSSGEVVN